MRLPIILPGFEDTSGQVSSFYFTQIELPIVALLYQLAGIGIRAGLCLPDSCSNDEALYLISSE